MRVSRHSVALVLLLGSAIPARADVIPPMPWQRQLPMYFRFDNLEDYPEFDFYLIGRSPPSSYPTQVVKVSSGVPTRLFPGRYGLEVRLLALPRGQPVPKFSSFWSHEEHKWAEVGPPGARYSPQLRATPQAGWTTSFDLTDHYLMPYRVTVRELEIQVEALPAEWRLDYLRTMILGLSLSLVFVAIGLWIARRRRKAADGAQAAPPAPV